MHGLLRAGVLGFVLALSSAVLAGPPTDVVRLKNGGMVRGSILELVPGSFVVVELKNGETRRFEMSDVEYAGPEEAAKPAPAAEAAPAEPSSAEDEDADEAPEPDDSERKVVPQKPPKRAAPRHGEPRRTMARVRSDYSQISLRSDEEDITFHLRTGTTSSAVNGVFLGRSGGFFAGVGRGESFERLCTAPCEVELENGVQHFAISRADGPTLSVEEGVHIEGTTVLNGKYESYRGVRIAGGIVGITGLVLMAVAVPVSFRSCEPPGAPGCEPMNLTLFGTLLGIGTGATIAGSFMFFKRDEAHITSGWETEEARTPFQRAVGGGPSVRVGQRWSF